MGLEVQVITGFLVLEPATAWRMLQQTHPELLTGARRCACGATDCTVDDVAGLLERKIERYLTVGLDQKLPPEIIHGHIRNADHSLIVIERLASDAPDAERWVAPFLAATGFRQAWACDAEYTHWQNAYDPLQYTAVGRSYAGLPMKSNGLPYPLERVIIDTSANPGRREIRKGYVEFVAALMWLGAEFWPLTGAKKEEVLAAGWLKCQELPHGVLRVQAADEPFTSDQGEQRQVQERLRKLLYPAASASVVR